MLFFRATCHSHYPGFPHRRDAKKTGVCSNACVVTAASNRRGACSRLVLGQQEIESGIHFVQDIVHHFKVLFLCQLADSPSLSRPEDLGAGPPHWLRNHRALMCSGQPCKQPCSLRQSLKGRNRLSVEAGASGRAAENNSPRRRQGVALAAGLAPTGPTCS